MTLTLELTPEQEAKLKELAQAAGEDPSRYALRLIDSSLTPGSPHADMAAHLRKIGVLGAVKGEPRADGRPWSEIEAACDSH